MSSLPELRTQVTDEQRAILNALWEYYDQNDEWPYVSIPYLRFGKNKLDSTLASLDANIIVATTNGTDRKRVRLTFVGILLTDHGEYVETLIIEYLSFVRDRVAADPKLREIRSGEFTSVADLSEIQSSSFWRVLSMSPFINGGSGGKDWSANLPSWIDEIVTVDDISAFFQEKALSRLKEGPISFLSTEDIVAYATKKDPTKNWDDHLKQIYDTLRNLRVDTIDTLDKVIRDTESRKILDKLYLKVLKRTTVSDWVGILSYQPIIFYQGMEGQDIVEQQLLASAEYTKIESEQQISVQHLSSTQYIPESHPRSAKTAPRLFLCYAKQDKATVRKLYGDLKKEGLSPWLDEVNILAGQDWEFEIKRAIQKSDFFLACLSGNSVDKQGYVQKEIKMGLEVLDQMPEGKSYLIPVRLEDCQVPDRLKHRHWVDLFASDGLSRLLQAIQIQTKTENAQEFVKTSNALGDVTSDRETSLLHQVWDKLEPDLQDAISMAYNQARRDGRNNVKTRYFFAALARLQPEPLGEFLSYVPPRALPKPIDEPVTTEQFILREDVDFSGCVEDSLRHLAPKATPNRRLTSADVFVDIARYGTGDSVARFRSHGLTPERVNQIVNELHWDVVER